MTIISTNHRHSASPYDGTAPVLLSTASLVTLIALPQGYALLPLGQSREDTAAWLGLGITKVQQLINAGELETAKVDGRTLILTRSAIALIERNLVRRDR